MADPAWANHPKKGKKGSLVSNSFNGPAPPKEIECLWVHKDSKTNKYVHAYVCTDQNNYRQALSTTDDQGLLRAGGNPPGYEVANPDKFTCGTKVANATPEEVNCEYWHRNGGKKHKHTFRMSQMVTMFDPDDSFVYVWPPHLKKNN